MPDFVTTLYLILMFIALYMFAFFISLTIKNRKTIFSHPDMKEVKSVSVIVPAYNEEDSIEETIKHVMALDYDKRKLEVLVVNDGSKDRTAEIVKSLIGKYSNLKLIDKKNSGKADSLNVAIKQAKGELIAVVDSDSFPSSGSLQKLAGFFEDNKMGAVTSFVRVRNYGENFLAKIQGIEYLIMGWTRKLLDYVDSVYVTNGPLSLYKKDYVLKVGGFDTKTVTEDIDVTWNLMAHGYKTGMCLDASVSTIAPSKFGAWFKQRTRWGLGGLQAIVKYRKMFFKRGMFGIFVLPFVSFSIILSLVAFLFSSYLVLRFAFIKILTIGYSFGVDASIVRFNEINVYPPVLIFYFVVLFSLSLSYTWYILKTTGFSFEDRKIGIARLFNILFYMIVYLSIYPIIWFASIYRYIRKDNRW